MKTTLFFLIIISTVGNIKAQYTNIPDPNFEQALIDLNIDSDGVVNGQVLTADIADVTLLNVSNKGIGDLTGIEDFAALEELDVSDNDIASLIFTNNLQLKKISIHNRSFFSPVFLDVSNNLLLEYLYCYDSRLSSLDLTNNVLLKELILGEASPGPTSFLIEQLDLSNNNAIEKLWIYNLESLEYINLNSGGNTILLDVQIHCSYDGGVFCQTIPCVEVDDFSAAQANQHPYSLWTADVVYSEECSLGTSALEKNSFSLFPNPTSETLVIENIKNNETATLRIYTINNNLLYTEILDSSYNKIDVRHLSTGVYFIVVENATGKKVAKKFIKK